MMLLRALLEPMHADVNKACRRTRTRKSRNSLFSWPCTVAATEWKTESCVDPRDLQTDAAASTPIPHAQQWLSHHPPSFLRRYITSRDHGDLGRYGITDCHDDHRDMCAGVNRQPL